MMFACVSKQYQWPVIAKKLNLPLLSNAPYSHILTKHSPFLFQIFLFNQATWLLPKTQPIWNKQTLISRTVHCVHFTALSVARLLCQCLAVWQGDTEQVKNEPGKKIPLATNYLCSSDCFYMSKQAKLDCHWERLFQKESTFLYWPQMFFSWSYLSRHWDFLGKPIYPSIILATLHPFHP